MKYTQQYPMKGLNILVTETRVFFTPVTSGNLRFSDKSYKKFSRPWRRYSSEEYWIYLGPTTLTDWNE